MIARVVDRLRRRLARRDGGFVLLESIITISLITIVMSAIGVEFVGSISAAGTQRAKQLAVQVADSQVEGIRALPASALASSPMWSPIGSAPATLRTTWLAGMDDAGGAVAPAQLTRQQGSLTYDVNDYLGWCYLPVDGSSTNCGPAAALPAGVSGIKYLRVVVAVTWSGAHCDPARCSYVTATLTSAATDPTFKVNQPLPAAPVVATPATQVSAIGDSVSLQLLVKAGTGVPMFTWSATGLPPGLAMSPAGLIQGTVDPSAQVQTYPVTVTVVDMFVRSASATFSWQILPRLVASNPDRASFAGSALSPAVQLTATGGTGSGYVWSDPKGTLPPGLSISPAGTITGTPGRVGTYRVAVVVTDSSGVRNTTSTFTWNVTYPPLTAVNPGTLTATLNTPVGAVQLGAGGGSGTYSWSVTGLPTGLSATAGGLISGTPAATGSFAVAATVTDAPAGATQTTAFTWNVGAAPTVGTPGTLSATESRSVSVALGYTCPNGPCTVAVSGRVPGVGLSATPGYSGNNATTSLQVSGSGTIYLTGTVQSTAVAGSAPSAPFTPAVSITDHAGATATSAAGSWTIFNTPAVSVPAASVAETGTPAVPVPYSCPNGPCTLTLSGSVPGIGLGAGIGNGTPNVTTTLTVPAGSGTAYLTGLVSATAVLVGNSKAYTPTVTISDATAVTSAPASGGWTVYVRPSGTYPGGVTVARNATVSQPITVGCYSGGCTVTVSGLPAGIGLSTSAGNTAPNATTTLNLPGSGTVYLSGTVSAAAASGKYAVTVTVADPINKVSVSTASVGVWTVP